MAAAWQLAFPTEVCVREFGWNGFALSNSRDGARLKADPSLPEQLVLKNYAGITNTSHDVPVMWSGLACKRTDELRLSPEK